MLAENKPISQFMQEWRNLIQNQPTVVESDEDIPEDIRDDVLKIRQNFADLGIDTSSLYLIDFDIGGPVLAIPHPDRSAVTLMFEYQNKENENEKR